MQEKLIYLFIIFNNQETPSYGRALQTQPWFPNPNEPDCTHHS